MSPGRTSGAPSPLSGAEGACGGVGNTESEALGRSGSDPHEEIKRAAATKITLSSFNFPFIEENRFTARLLISSGRRNENAR
jgi:hypothetical protein